MALAIFYIALVVNNFKVSSLVYDYLVVSFFDQFQGSLHDFFKALRKVFEQKVYKTLGVIRDIIFAFLSMIIERTPTAVQLPLQMLGVTAFLDQGLEKFNEAKEQIGKKEEQREIERNRPGSPKKENVKDKKQPQEKNEGASPSKTVDGKNFKLNIDKVQKPQQTIKLKETPDRPQSMDFNDPK